MNYVSNPSAWAGGVHRHTHWMQSAVYRNPFENLAAPLIAAAANEVHINHDVDPLMAILMVVDAACLVSQGLVDVEVPGHRPSPISVNTLKVDGPARGKSLTHEVIFRPLYKIQSETKADREREKAQYERSYDIWETKRRALKQVIAKIVRNDGDSSAQDIALDNHLLQMPKSPHSGQFIFEDTTPAAFFHGVFMNGVSVMLGGAEGGTIMQGEALAEPQKFNALFSGEEVQINRKTASSYTLRGVRVNLGIAVQPDILKSFQESKKGKKAASSGFNARLLVCDATQYQKGVIQRPVNVTWGACEALHERLTGLMQRTLVSSHVDGFERDVIRFSVSAADRFGEIRCQVKSCTGKGCVYETAPDHAARIPEIVARLAALIHFFEGKPGDIDLGSLEAANSIVSQASSGYMRLFVPPPQELVDAALLDKHFDKFRSRGIFYLDRSYSSNGKPNSLRNEGRYDLAMGVLRQMMRVGDGFDSAGKSCLILMPWLNPYPYGFKYSGEPKVDPQVVYVHVPFPVYQAPSLPVFPAVRDENKP